MRQGDSLKIGIPKFYCTYLCLSRGTYMLRILHKNATACIHLASDTFARNNRHMEEVVL